MATILFVGGVAPDLTQEQLDEAFQKHGVPLLASSVVRHTVSGQCIGQAYVTVAEEQVRRAVEGVTQIGNNAVMVLPVSLEAWVAPSASGANATAAAAAASAPANGAAAGWGAAAATALPSASAAPSTAVTAAPAASVAAAAADGAPQVVVPSTSPTNAHLQAALDQLRSFLAGNPRVACNNKTFTMLLHEAAQKRQAVVQVAEAPEGLAFSCTLTLNGPTGPICSGRGVAPNKKDAKHNAAAACLDAMLRMGELLPRELIAGMTTQAPAAALGGGGGAGGGGGVAANPAATTAMAQTQAILQLGMYPRCSEVMGVVHSTDTGRAKTVLMVLNEFATRNRMTVQHQEVPSPLSSPLAGPFRFMTTLTDALGQIVVQATGVELRSKQESKQAAAAAAVEALVTLGVASVEALARGK